MTGVVVNGVRRLSTITEQEADVEVHSEVSLGAGGWAGSSTSLCSRDRTSSSGLSSESSQPDAGEDCAAILLACLYCRFHEMMVMVPETCDRAVTRRLPSCRQCEGEQAQGKDCCSVELDCGLLDVCQETGDLLELALEVSEVCYR